MESPFSDIPKEDWYQKRNELIEKHPLSIDEIKGLVLSSFESLLSTRIGDPADNVQIFEDIDISSQVQGDFLEAIMAREICKIDSDWTHGSEAEKDFIYDPKPYFSTELKTSGQEGVTKVFGNRSYAQKVQEDDAKKSKTGYYITVNFYKDLIYLIRFGWIDFEDWTGQSAASGQAATLSDEVYEYKLKDIKGDYRLNAPVTVIDGVGDKTKERIKDELDFSGTITVRKFIELYEESIEDYGGRVRRAYENAKEYKSQATQE
jgi:hypothetical protein